MKKLIDSVEYFIDNIIVSEWGRRKTIKNDEIMGTILKNISSNSKGVYNISDEKGFRRGIIESIIYKNQKGSSVKLNWDDFVNAKFRTGIKKEVYIISEGSGDNWR